MTNLVSMAQSKLPLSKWSSNYIKILILLCIPFNTALAGTFFSDDFESGDMQSAIGGFWNAPTGDVSASTENPRTGKYSMRLSFKKKNENGYSNTEQRFKFNTFQPDVWVKYDLYVPLNYVHEDHGSNAFNKGPMFIWGTNYDTSKSDGPKLGYHYYNKDLTSSQISSTDAYATAYINGVKSDLGHGAGGTNHWFGDAITENDRGHWMTLVLHFKYATKANNDGVMELWKTDWQGNTVKGVNIQDGPWYATKANSNEPANGFNEGYFMGWANQGFPEQTVFYIDNVQFSTTPLSADSEFQHIAAPKPPTIFSQVSND